MEIFNNATKVVASDLTKTIVPGSSIYQQAHRKDRAGGLEGSAAQEGIRAFLETQGI